MLIGLTACGGDDAAGPDAGPTCDYDLSFATGDDGVADPLAWLGGSARAGRVADATVFGTPGGLSLVEAGDFVLANDKVAMVIEDVGASDMYDPWGGKPIGLSRLTTVLEGGAPSRLAPDAPSRFGEMLLLTGRNGVLVQEVSVLHDGQDGQAAVVRAEGVLTPLPFFEAITGNLFRDTYPDIPVAIDYVLAPGAEHVDVELVFHSPLPYDSRVATVMHGFLGVPRTPIYAPELGFDNDGKDLPYAAFVDEGRTSHAYAVPGDQMGAGISASGFVAFFSKGFDIGKCGETRRTHARLTIGGPGLDGLLATLARAEGRTLRVLAGTVKQADGAAAVGVRVFAERKGATGFLTKTTTDADGHYTLHLPPDAGEVELTLVRDGDVAIEAAPVAADATTKDFTLAAAGAIHVVARDADSDAPLPVRVQVLPTSGGAFAFPGRFGEEGITGGRVRVDFAITGDTTLRVPAGSWRVVVSRGYEYEIVDETVQVAAGQAVQLNAALEQVVDTTGVQCADFHIHTHRSADSGDDAELKVRSAVADGLEIPVRSEHEYVDDFRALIAALGMTKFAYGVGSIEMTSMELWGHMGVVPLTPDPTLPNAGAPLWQEYPTATQPGVALRTKEPPEVFQMVRQRAEQPVVIINHPRGGGTNYFDYAGYDPVTGLPQFPERWDEDFTLVEFFNDSGWQANRGSKVVDWLSFLDHGRRVFAVGSSDSHGIKSSPVGYPRTCLEVGTDDPSQLTPELVRDATAGGHSTISGGIYVDASVGAAGPGDDVMNSGPTATVRVRVQAASWVDVDAIELVVDGQTVDTIAIVPGDADPQDPTVRFDKEFTIDVAAGHPTYVIVAAYGDRTLEPVHPGRVPFGVTNPIFLHR